MFALSLSDSWQYFELLSPDNGRSRKARCTFCGHEQAAGITRLHQHLLYRCSRITSDIREELRQKHGDRERESPPKTNDLLSHHHIQQQQHPDSVNYHFNSSTLQNTLSNNNSNNNNSSSSQQTNHHSPTNNMNPHATTYYETTTLSPTTVSTNFTATNPIAFTSTHSTTNTTPSNSSLGQQQSMLDCQLARAFFSANIPFESIENPHMINFLKRLQPNYIVPKGRRLKQFILKEQHWDLIPWDNEHELMLTRQHTQQQSPPTPMLPQQQQRRMMLSDANNNSNDTTNLNNRLLSSLHPPTDLEGSL